MSTCFSFYKGKVPVELDTNVLLFIFWVGISFYSFLLIGFGYVSLKCRYTYLTDSAVLICTVSFLHLLPRQSMCDV